MSIKYEYPYTIEGQVTTHYRILPSELISFRLGMNGMLGGYRKPKISSKHYVIFLAVL